MLVDAGSSLDYTKTRDRTWLVAFGCLFAIVITVLTALRTNPEHVRVAQYWRAFLGRGVIAAIMLALLTCGIRAVFFALSRTSRELPHFASIAVLSAAAGFGIQALCTMALARAFDRPLLAAFGRLNNRSGIVRIETRAAGTMSVRPRSSVGYDRMEPGGEPTPLEISLTCAAEDERCDDRVSNIDIRAVARAIAGWLRQHNSSGTLTGASGLGEQIAGLELKLKPRNGVSLDYKAKVEKILAGFRVADLLGSTREEVRMYLQIAPFGSIDGHEAVGIAAASLAFYGRPHTELRPAQIIELLSHLKNPNVYFPYRKSGENEERFARHQNQLRARFDAIINIATNRRIFTETEAIATKSEYLSGLVPVDQARLALSQNWIERVVDEVRGRVTDYPDRWLVVRTHFRSDLQAILDAVAQNEAETVRAKLSRREIRGDSIVVDAEVIDGIGGIIAETGLVSQADGMASNMKTEDYGFALALGIIRSANDIVPGTQMTVRAAVESSNNDAARNIARRIGIARLADFFRSEGYTVTGDYRDIAIGSGVAGWPRLMAGNFLKYSYETPGVRVYPDWLIQIADGSTGEILFAPEARRVFAEQIAAVARSIFEGVSLNGTAAAALRNLAVHAPIAAKTGTVGFHKGHGGSLCIATDSATHLTIAVRMRWTSGHPLQVDGGHSAAYVIRDFLARARACSLEVLKQ